MLEAPITEDELISAIQTLLKGKNMRLDGLMAYFFESIQEFTSVDFTMMVNKFLICSQFPRESLVGSLPSCLKKETC